MSPSRNGEHFQNNLKIIYSIQVLYNLQPYQPNSFLLALALGLYTTTTHIQYNKLFKLLFWAHVM